MMQARVVESTVNRGAWKVWVQSPTGTGFLRQGFAWKTKNGAERALQGFLKRKGY